MSESIYDLTRRRTILLRGIHSSDKLIESLKAGLEPEVGSYESGFRDGVKMFRTVAVSGALSRVCFGHRETGECEHQLCWGLMALIEELEK